MIEDKELQAKWDRKLEKVRELNQNVGDRQTRLAIDEHLTHAYLIAKYGNLKEESTLTIQAKEALNAEYGPLGEPQR